MVTWFPLLGAPVLMLMDQMISYATAGWACANQDSPAIHLAHGVFLACTLAGAIAATDGWRSMRTTDGSDEMLARRRFLAGVAAASAALSSLVIVAMWIATWIVAPCVD
jgi:hypothetical protein